MTNLKWSSPVSVYCITLTILSKKDQKIGIKKRPCTVIQTVCNWQNILVKVKQVPRVAASVPVNIGGAKRESVNEAYSGFQSFRSIWLTSMCNVVLKPFMASYGDD